ncbi:methyl-accepting chemotaxis protein [Paenibacillus sp. y28]|uniref:methyl-accepting chemotaxis protein n=1 Tax=Paenibacillus sp. y28 TaxID=3129110 RepID=UPI0030168EC5
MKTNFSPEKGKFIRTVKRTFTKVMKGAKVPGRLGTKDILSDFKVTNPAKSVGMKLFLTFFISILVFVLVVGETSYLISKGIIQDKVAIASEQTVTQASEKLDLMLNIYEDLTMQMVVDQSMQSLMDQYYSSPKGSYDQLKVTQDIGNKLNTLALTNKTIASISLLDRNGERVFTSGGTLDKSSYSDEEWFKQTLAAAGKAVWLGTKKKGTSGKLSYPAFSISRVIKNASSNTITSIFLVEIKLETLSDQVQAIMGGAGKVYIVDQSNKVMQANDLELLEQDSPIDMSKVEASKGRLEDIMLNGEKTLAVYSTLEKNGWKVVGALPVAELTKQTDTIFMVTIIMSACAAIVAVIIGLFVMRMMRPLVHLRNLMKEGEEGNLTVRTNFQSNNEIGQLGQSFNQMMEKITQLVNQTTVSAQEVLSTAEQLSDSSKKTATSAREIALATEEIANGASSLAVEAERGNEITYTISEQMNQVVSANSEMKLAATEVQKASEQGTHFMAELTAKTNSTELMTRSMVEKVDQLKESTRSIRKILDVLNNLTKQTNILSLNATIEAARAGAAGKGFMVVADEIRKLADQSRHSISVVGEITETIQSGIDETVSVLSAAYPLFQEQIGSVKETDVIFQQVQQLMGGFVEKLNEATASIQQLNESQNVLSDAMTNVSAVAEESSATSQEVASLSNEQSSISEGLVRLADNLEGLSNSLRDSLSKFRTQ